MNHPDQFALDLRHKLEETGYAGTLSPAELDDLLQNFYDSGRHKNLLHQLAEHYKVPYDELMDLLVGRQMIYLSFMTDESVPGNELALHDILRKQNAKLAELVERLSERVSQLDEAIRQTVFLRNEAARVLAYYKGQSFAEQRPQDKPK